VKRNLLSLLTILLSAVLGFLVMAWLLRAPSFGGEYCDEGTFIRGDTNCDGDVDVSDLVYLGDYLYQSGETPDRLDSGDFDDDGEVGVTDLTLLGYFLYQSGDPPCCPYPDEDKDTVGAEVGDDLDNCVSQPSDVTLTLTGDEIARGYCDNRWTLWPLGTSTREFCGTDDNEAKIVTSDGSSCESPKMCSLWDVTWDVDDGGGFTAGRLSNQIQDAAFSVSGTVDFIVQTKCGDAPPAMCPSEDNILLAGFDDDNTSIHLYIGPTALGEANTTIEFLFDDTSDLVFSCEYFQDEQFGACALVKSGDCDEQHVVATVAAELNITDELLEALDDEEAGDCDEWRIYGVEVVGIETLLSLYWMDQAAVNAIEIHLVPFLQYVYHGCDDDNFEITADHN
jgi:hypothetical protein